MPHSGSLSLGLVVIYCTGWSDYLILSRQRQLNYPHCLLVVADATQKNFRPHRALKRAAKFIKSLRDYLICYF